MIKVDLVNWVLRDALETVSYAALTCYQDVEPEWGKIIDLKTKIFETGHHSVLQHIYCVFRVEGIAVGDVTFGLHLANPFYNSSQRSGRFCAKMFANPDIESLVRYFERYAEPQDLSHKKDIVSYIEEGLNIYRANLEKAVILANEFIREDRPRANDKYLQQNGPKIAQEQMRIFVPVIFPTALVFTINLSVLAALYKVAWSLVLEDVTQKMVNKVLAKWPAFSFAYEGRRTKPDGFSIMEHRIGVVEKIMTKPLIEMREKSGHLNRFPAPEDLHPIDLLHFDPSFMAGNIANIKTSIKISVATMGQDQRHRTIDRGQPRFSGDFYLPPIPAALGLGQVGWNLLERWISFEGVLSESLFCRLAPYGTMVSYQKRASYNAATHELNKRLCWCAQEEIYHLARDLRLQLGNDPLTQIMSPRCVQTGKCGEGARYCGRDLNEIKNNPFPIRRV